jgi:hypothetical protein
VNPGAAVDCERILASWWGQPVNTATCAAFLVGAAVIWWKDTDRVMAALVAMIGIGSIAFHGPMPFWGEFVHDLAIVWALVWVILVEFRLRRWWLLALPLSGLLALTPAIADPGQALLAATVLFIQLRSKDHITPRRIGIGLLAVGALIGTLSRTGWPLCNPDSFWQGHGFWHICSAAALTLWAGWIRQVEPAGQQNV